MRDTYLSVLFVWRISRSLGTRLRLDSTLALPLLCQLTGCSRHPHGSGKRLMSRGVWTVRGQGPWALMSYWAGGCTMDRGSRKAVQCRTDLSMKWGSRRWEPELSSMAGSCWSAEGCTEWNLSIRAGNRPPLPLSSSSEARAPH